MAKLSKLEREEAERVLAATSDTNLGAGIWLRFPRSAKAERSAYLIFRFTSPAGKRREMGLGAMARTSVSEVAELLAKARTECGEYREQLRKAVDPLEAKDAAKEHARQALQVKVADSKSKTLTLARCARAYHERVIESTRSGKHVLQWINSLEQHVPAGIWHAPIGGIKAPDLLDFFIEIRRKLPETGTRIVQRLCTVFHDAEFREQCKGNPAAAAAKKLREVKMPKTRGKLAALDYRLAPAFMRDLRSRPGIAARALEFAMLTAARTGEVVGATWDEFDLKAGVWTIPAERMKGGDPHTVYLSPRAIEIARSMEELRQPFVFPTPRLDDTPLSDMAMLTLLRRMDADKSTTVHGLCRATFSTWANECGIGRPDVIEACLAHRERNLVKAAYNRAQFTKERAALLAAWSDYLDNKQPAHNVVPIRSVA